MNGALYAIQITDNDLKVLRIRRENGGAFAAPLAHIHASEESGPGDTGLLNRLAALREETGEEHPRALIVLNGQDLDFRDFSYPFDADRKVRHAIEFELSTDYPEKEYIQDTVKALSREPGYHTFLAGLIHRSVLKERVQAVEGAGFRIEGITSDVSTLGLAFRLEEEALVMDTGEHHTLFVLYRSGVPVLLRKIPIGTQVLADRGAGVQFTAEIKRTIHSFSGRTGLRLDRLHVTGNLLRFEEVFTALQPRIPVEVVAQPAQDPDVVVEDTHAPSDVRVFAALVGAALWKRKGPAFHFFKDEFGAADSALFLPRLLRWGSAFVGIFLLLLLLSYGLEIMTLRERRDFLQAEMRNTFTSAFPQVNRIVDEVKQARNILDMEMSASAGGPLQSGDSLLEAFRGLSATIPADIPFEIVSLFWETGKMEIYGRTDSFKTVNAVQEVLARHEGFSEVTISNARYREEGQDVEFKLSIHLAG